SKIDSVYLFQCYSNTYVKARQYDKAKFYVNALIGLESRFEINDMILRSIYLPANTYFMATHQYALAEKYADAFFELAMRIAYQPDIVHGYMLKAKADSASGNLLKALTENYLYNKKKDSMLNETKSFQFAQMQVIYETEKKDNNIQLLTARNQVQEASFRKANLIRNVIIASILSLLVFAFLAYKSKQRNNARLKAQQQEINMQNTELKNLVSEKNQLLTEKEWLVKEIHHRVKNNLQIIISLLNTQSNYLNNKEAIDAISESSHRMQAMSLIHQKLYQSEDTKSVNMRVYIHELADYLETSFAGSNKISFNLGIDDIDLDITQAIPVGLILNESITNAIKYAFISGESGSIHVRMKIDAQHEICLEIADNGRGFPEHFNVDESDSMGMILIRGLVKQIGGKLEINNDHGARIAITFNLDKSLKLTAHTPYQS
ncbi:MAG: sensor histidine kinase, partial [Bacteroidota bacterium]